MVNPALGPVAVVGSGELSDSMAEVHRTVMARVGEPVQAVFIDTPAGFETNVDQIGQKAQAYFQRNFDLDLQVACYHGAEATPADVAAAVTAIQQANYLFAGPGSPSYAVRMWRDSPVWRAVLARWEAGAALVFASAAALTLGRYTIPVYEIYKAGDDIRWLDGLDALAWLGSVAVVPHWNNNSGEQYDTRFCFMGAARFERLEAQLPPATLILGVDEYTGLLIDPVPCEARVLGAGTVTSRVDGQQAVYRRGQGIRVDKARVVLETDAGDVQGFQTPTPTPRSGRGQALSQRERGPDPDRSESVDGDIALLREAVQGALVAGEFERAVEGLVTLSLIAGAGLEQGLPERAERAVQALQTVLPLLANQGPSTETVATDEARRALVELLIDNRAQLRRTKQFALADRLRDRLGDLGYILEDTPNGTIWRR